MQIIAMTVMGEAGHAYNVTISSAGVVSCQCKSWKFQAKPVAQRTCKHIEFIKTKIGA